MKQFQFLEEHAWFQSKSKASENYDTYNFENTTKNDTERAFILIPKPEYPGLSLLWQYQYFHQEKNMVHLDSSVNQIEHFPKGRDKWFYELVREANDSLEKRDRIRKILK